MLNWQLKIMCCCGSSHLREAVFGEHVEFICEQCAKEWEFYVSFNWLPKNKSAIKAGLPNTEIFALKIYNSKYFLQPLEVLIISGQ